ncbi:MAG: hypothetical protein AAB590_00060 [Patescibacteria group bacterium]
MKNTQRGFVPLVILIIIIAGAVTGGGYAVSKQRAKDRAKEPNANATSTAQMQAIATSSKPSLPPQASATATSATSKEVINPKPVVAPTVVPTVTYGGDLKVLGSLGWPVKVSSTIDINGSIDSFPGMVVVKVLPKVTNSAEYTVTISGLPADTDLYVYTNGYRIEEVKRTNASGELVFKLTTPQQFIIKATKS